MHDYSTKINKQLFWNRNMIETFIKLYKENGCLYNRSHPDYNSKLLKTEVLRNILQKMKEFLPNLKLKDVQDKLKTIRKQFSAELSLINDAETLGNAYVPKLWCFDQLEFLRKYVDSSRGEKSDSSEENNDINDAHSDSSDISYELNLPRSSPEYRWEREETKIFINLFKKFKVLYDPKHKHYNNNKLRCKARLMLLKEVQKIDPRISVKIVESKIKHLRRQYMIEQKRIRKAEENNQTYTPRLWYFNLLTFLNNGSDIKSNCDPSTKTTYTEFEDNNICEIHQSQGININDDNFNNESYEIEPIHHVIIENEVDYEKEMPNANATQINQTVVDYECDNTFNFDTHDLQHGDYKQNFEKNETDFIEEIIHHQFRTKLENNNESIKKIAGEKYEWLGDLVVSQLGIISPRYHNELASDVQSLIQKYIKKSKSSEDKSSTSCSSANNQNPSSISHDIFLRESPNVSFNLRIL